jgi:transcriptional regulator with XRE-family HTH domain
MNSSSSAVGATFGPAQASSLTSFLRERRGRLSPAACGLPASTRRRSAGLTRADVAELLDASPLWYALFESAKPGRRFSASFVYRLAHVLRLDAADRDTLCRLVVERGLAADDLETEWQWGRLMSAVAQASWDLAAAPTPTQALEQALEAFRALLAPVQPVITLAAERASSSHVSVADADGRAVRRTMIVPISSGAEALTIRIDSPVDSAFTSAEVLAVEMIALHLRNAAQAA